MSTVLNIDCISIGSCKFTFALGEGSLPFASGTDASVDFFPDRSSIWFNTDDFNSVQEGRSMSNGPIGFDRLLFEPFIKLRGLAPAGGGSGGKPGGG